MKQKCVCVYVVSVVLPLHVFIAPSLSHLTAPSLLAFSVLFYRIAKHAHTHICLFSPSLAQDVRIAIAL